jgi:tRNA(fMet)-specific endonuclease VapC
VFLPVPVVGELRFGALNSGRPHDNIQRVEKFLAGCQVLDARTSTAEVYARVRLDLKRIGRPIPENDIWIAALCIEHDAPLATHDGHFDFVNGLKVVRRP